MQPVTISATLNCITWGEMVVRPYDGSLLRRLELTIAYGPIKDTMLVLGLVELGFFFG